MDTALILAGGQSARFGRPKAVADIAGQPMIRRVADAIAPLAGELVVSVAASAMVPVLETILPEGTCVVDQRPDRGPIEGFHRGFAVARGERVLVAPCDAPLLRRELYRLLLSSLGSYDAAVPKFEVFDPVRAVYRRAEALRVLTSAKPEVTSPSALVDRLRCHVIGPDRIRAVDPDLSSFNDVNTQADLDELGAKLESRKAGRRRD